MSKTNGKSLILLSGSFPYGTGEVFLENEIPVLLENFDRVFVLPMLPVGKKRPIDDRVNVILPAVAETSRLREFLRGLKDSMFFKEWKSTPVMPFNPKLLYLVARTLGIARRIEHTILQTYNKHNLADGIIYSYWMMQSCLGGLFAAQQLNWPAVSRTHGGDLYAERYYGAYIPWQNYKVRHLTKIFPISANGKTYLIKNYNGSDQTITVSRLGVSDRGIINHEPGSGEQVHIASCSQVYPLKRVESILDTVTVLAQKAPSNNVRWTHIGGGPDYDKLKSSVEKLSISNLEVVLTGNIPNNKIIPLYIKNEVDVFINYSSSEGIPVSIMEALSCGIPVYAPNVGGISEIIDETNGFLFNSNDSPESVSASILEDLEEDRLPHKGKNARDRWEKEYHLQKNYEAFAKSLLMLKTD